MRIQHKGIKRNIVKSFQKANQRTKNKQRHPASNVNIGNLRTMELRLQKQRRKVYLT